MPRAQRRKAETLIRIAISVVPYADERMVQRRDDRGDHPFARKPALAKILLHPFTKLRQRSRKGREAAEFCFVTMCRPLGVVAILFAPAQVTPGRLYVADGISADPHIGPRRRYGQHTDPPQRLGVLYPIALRIAIAETLAKPASCDARFAIVHIGQVWRRKRLLRVTERIDRHVQ